MAMENLKDFSMEWILFGILFFSLITFGIAFMYNNNPGGLGTEGDKLSGYGNNISSSLVAVEGSSNSLLNTSAQNNPELSDLGSKDSVATSYGITGVGRNFISGFMPFMGWIITGTAGKMLVSIFLGMFGLMALYFITKWIRQGG